MFLPFVLASVERFDLRFEAAPAARVVAALAKKSGVALSVDPAVGREIVAVDLPGIASDDAMRRLARVLDAKWENQNGRPTLRRSLDAAGSENRNFSRAAREGYARALASLAPVPPFDAETYAQAKAIVREASEGSNAGRRERDPASVGKAALILREANPLARLTSSLIASLTPTFIEGIGQGRAVFCTHPNALQRRATPAQERAFAEYLREETAVRRLGASDGAPSGWTSNPAAALETVIDGSSSGTWMRVRVLDAGGIALEGTSETLRPDLRPLVSLRPMASEARMEPPPDDLPPEGKVPENARDRLLDVRRRDPLTRVGAWLLRCAEARHEDLVAVMGDDLLENVPYSAEEPGRYLVDLANQGYVAREEDGTLWVAPLDRVGTRARQMDRDALAGWLDAERAGRRLTVDDYARMTRRFPLVSDSGEMIRWLDELGVPDAAWNTPFLGDALRLPRGRTLRLEDVPTDVRDRIVARIVEAGPGDYRVRIVGPGICGTGAQYEPDGTDEFPQGLPREATLRLDDTREPCLVPIPPGRAPLYVWNPITATDLEHDPSWYDLAVRLGTVRRIDLTVDLGRFGKFQERVEAVEGLGGFVDARTVPDPLGAAVRHAIVETERRFPSNG